ncbi:TIGR04149 family rSAM-modified RiPP [Brevibacillus fluminis]|uniref:TIGR04149 family rSAM-modified RiPP n=1 Tax=Brevibacillus fluminis TaxID=511487 RepID=UPI003F8A3F48
MAENEKQQNELTSLELTDLSEELSEQQLKDVKGGDWKIGSKPPVGKRPINP